MTSTASGNPESPSIRNRSTRAPFAAAARSAAARTRSADASGFVREHPGGAERRDVGGALAVRTARADRRQMHQHHRAERDHDRDPDARHRHLAVLAADHRIRPTACTSKQPTPLVTAQTRTVAVTRP